ncbi:MAG: acetyl-CoA hydrolase/transferase family protein [Peptococcaceae bacterium]
MSAERIRNKNLLKKVVSPEVAAGIIKNGMTIGTHGAINVAYPKAFFKALAERGKKGEIKEINLWTISLFGPEGVLAEAGIVKRKLGSIGDNTLRKQINAGKVSNNDLRPEVFPLYTRSKVIGKVDVAVIDAVAITEEGHIVPSHTLVDAATYVEMADIVIVEINHAQPVGLEGMHDVYCSKLPPHQREVSLYHVGDRVGTPYIPAGEDKITYIIESFESEKNTPASRIDPASQKLGEHLISFLKEEVKRGKMPSKLYPIASGIGSASDAFLSCLAQSDFENIEIFTPVLGDGVLELIDQGKCKVASTPGFLLSEEKWQRFCQNIDKYKDKIIIRSVEVTNNAEIVRRLGVIALNNLLEIDIYGNINSSHIGGTQLVNGVGGAGVFAANGYLSVFLTLSTSRKGSVSAIVPMVPHVDLTEHNIDVLVTEQGLADLRGLSPVERAENIINNCAHPDYRPLLNEYLEKAKKTMGGHEPHILEEAFSFHLRLQQTGSMK